MKAIERLSVIQQKSTINKNWKHKELFRILRKEDIWIAAYDKIKRRQNPSLAVSKLTVWDRTRLKKLSNKITNENYQFQIPCNLKIKSSKDSVKFFSMNDQIVQEVIRMILEAIYNPFFSKQKFCFCENFEKHNALKHIESKFQQIDWVIEGSYSNINKKQLCKILSEKIHDVKFLNLIRKLLNCGFLEQRYINKSFKKSLLEVLTNIYYNELDLWVQTKIKLLNLLTSKRQTQFEKHRRYSTVKIRQQLKNLKTKSKNSNSLVKRLKRLNQKKFNISNLLTNCIKIEYIRCGNKLMIGLRGNKNLVNSLKIEVNNFGIQHQISFQELKITDLVSNKIKFLEYEIYCLRNKNPNYYFNLKNEKRMFVRFDVPINFILKNLEKRGYIKKVKKGYRSISKTSYTTFHDNVIVEHFSTIWIRLIDYYSGCTNRSKLQYIYHLLYLSCAMTLSHKHRSSIKKIFSKYKKTLSVSHGNVKMNFPSWKKWSLTKKKWQINRLFLDPV